MEGRGVSTRHGPLFTCHSRIFGGPGPSETFAYVYMAAARLHTNASQACQRSTSSTEYSRQTCLIKTGIGHK